MGQPIDTSTLVGDPFAVSFRHMTDTRLLQIRTIVLQHARLTATPEQLTPTADLYTLGLSSMTTVHLMVALEDQFGVEFPDRLLSRKTFQSLQSMSEAVEELQLP